MARRPLFYGYVIVAICLFNMVLMRGILASFSVFNIALVEAFRWSRASTGAIASVNGVIYSFSSPLVGWAYDRLGPRILMPVGGVLIGVGLLVSSASRTLWHFHVGYGLLVGLGIGCIGFVSNTALLSHWFRRRRGAAIGVATMGLGFGTLLVPVMQAVITRHGWRAAMLLLGVAVLATIVPVNALFQRPRPEDIGQLPDGDSAAAGDTPAGPPESLVPKREWTLAQALSSFPFWAIAVGHLGIGTGLALMYTHAVAHLVHAGLSKQLAANVFSLVGVARIPSTAIWGFVSDRLGRDRAYLLGTLFTLAGVGVLMALHDGAPAGWFAAFAVLYGVGHSSGNPTFGSTIADIFGGRNVATIFGWLEITFGIGVAAGSWFGGYVFDVTGSYRYAWILGLASFTVAYLSIHACMAWKRRSHPAPA